MDFFLGLLFERGVLLHLENPLATGLSCNEKLFHVYRGEKEDIVCNISEVEGGVLLTVLVRPSHESGR